MSDTAYIEKIVSGTVAYCNKVAEQCRKQGYAIAKQHRCPDGKYIYVLRAPKRW